MARNLAMANPNTLANKRYSIVIGNVNGQLSEVFSKVAALHAKNSFTFALIAGNLFPNPESVTEAEAAEISKLLDGQIEVPIPTYFTIGTHGLPAQVITKLESNDGELCANLTVLGRRVSIKTPDGFKIVAVGGTHAQGLDQTMNQYEPIYTDEDLSTLAKDVSNADILVTSDWPAAIQNGSKAESRAETPKGVQGIADLCTALKPRYHFSASAAFYEREPFAHTGPTPRWVTRFISLAPYGNAQKSKWIMALAFEPATSPPETLPEGCTHSPFTSPKKRKLENQQEAFNSFRYSNGDSNGGSHRPYDRDRGRGKRQRQQPPPTPASCYFCLSNENCETHVIGSIGNDSYITVPKGPLTTRSTCPDLGFPGHLLLIPLHHSPTLASIPEDDARKAAIAEMERYRTALHQMVASKSEDENGRAKLGAVTWEISRLGGVHVHWQFLTLPVDLIQRGMVEAGFDALAEKFSYPKFAKTEDEISEAEAGDYLKVRIWSEAMQKEMVLPLDQSFRFNLQFGRRVMAQLLLLDARVDWRACAQSKEEESADAEVFKEAFKEFDFSLEE